MSKVILLKQYGDIVGAVLADQVVAAYVATNDEAMIYLELRNGGKIKHFGGYEDLMDELARIISELGWSE